MSKARHRRPRPVRDFFVGLWVLYLVSRYSERRARRATPKQIQEAGFTLAQMPWTAERVPLQVPYSEHRAGIRQMEEYLNGPGSA